MDLFNNTILITGGTSGFGLEFVKRFLELGNTVIITGRNIAKLEETKKRFSQVHIFQSDVSDIEHIGKLFSHVTQRFPELNILINNAGEMRKISLNQRHELADLTREIDINLSGPIHLIQQFLPHLKTRKKAAIVNVTSGIALMTFPISPIYSASKAGLRAYTKALRVQLRHTGIKVIELVAPGSNTPLNEKFAADRAVNGRALMSPEKIVDAAIKGIKYDQDEVYPGLSKLIQVMSRIAPHFLLEQASKAGKDFYSAN